MRCPRAEPSGRDSRNRSTQDLKQGKLSGFSIERLMRLLLVLGCDIEITVKGRAKSRSVARLRIA